MVYLFQPQEQRETDEKLLVDANSMPHPFPVDANSMPHPFPVKIEVDQEESNVSNVSPKPFNISKIVVFPKKLSSIFWVQEATVITNNNTTNRPARKPAARGASKVI